MDTLYRCGACGNRTRFDVYETVRRRRYHHYSLGGELDIEEDEVLERSIERVVCRWCGRPDQIEPGQIEPDQIEPDQIEPDEPH